MKSFSLKGRLEVEDELPAYLEGAATSRCEILCAESPLLPQRLFMINSLIFEGFENFHITI